MVQSRAFHSHRSSRACAVLFIIIGIFLLFGAERTYAASTNTSYELTKCEVRAEVNRDHSYQIDRTMTVQIPSEASSLTFRLPSDRYRITNMKVSADSYSVDDNENELVITIQSAKDLSVGEHEFTISYRVQEYEDNNLSADMFYLDVLSPNSAVPIGDFRMELTLPEDFPRDDLQFYAGQYGPQDTTNQLHYEMNGDTLTMTGSRLPNNFALTVKAQLPNGYWEHPLNNNWSEGMAAVVMLSALLLSILLWLIGGRDAFYKRKMLRFPLEDYSVVDVGYLLNGRVSVREIIALIMELGRKGYLRIEEYEPRKYRFYRLNDPSLSEERYVRSAFNTLFEGVYEGRALEMDDLWPRLREIIRQVEPNVESGYSAPDMAVCTTRSKVFRFLSILASALAIGTVAFLVRIHEYQSPSSIMPLFMTVLALIFLIYMNRSFDQRYRKSRARANTEMAVGAAGYLAVLGYVDYQLWHVTGNFLACGVILLAGIFFLPLTCIMKARGKANAKITNRLLGMRDFMEDAEEKDIIALQARDADYFFKMLPYAYLFSTMHGWGLKFRYVRVNEPSWMQIAVEGHAIPYRLGERNALMYTMDFFHFAYTIEDQYEAMSQHLHLFRHWR